MEPRQQRTATRKLQKQRQRRRLYYWAGFAFFALATTLVCTRHSDIAKRLELGKTQASMLEHSPLPLFLSTLLMGVLGLRRCDQSTGLVWDRKNAMDKRRKGHLRFRLERRFRMRLKAERGLRGVIKRGLHKLNS
jgi:hypothetical protein